MWRNYNPQTLLVGMKNGQLFWKTIWQFLRTLNIELPYNVAILFLSIYPRELKAYVHTNTYMQFFFFFFLSFLGLHPWHAETPRLRGQTGAAAAGLSTTAIAIPDLSRFCNLYCSSLQHWILNRLRRPGIEPTSSWILFRFITAEPQWELLCIQILPIAKRWRQPKCISNEAWKTLGLFPSFDYY